MNIVFQYFLTTPQGKRFASLLRSHRDSPEQVFEEACEGIYVAADVLAPGPRYWTRDLFDAEQRATWSPAKRNAMGIVASFLVTEKFVPFVRHYTVNGRRTTSYYRS